MSDAVDRAAEVLHREFSDCTGTPCVTPHRIDRQMARALADAGLLADGDTRTEWGVRTATTPEPVTVRGERAARNYVTWRRKRGESEVGLMRRTVVTGPWIKVANTEESR